MASKAKDSEPELNFILTSEEADRLVSEALNTEPDEPEGLVRLLLILQDHIHEPSGRIPGGRQARARMF